jgi:ubiquitin-protein ligase
MFTLLQDLYSMFTLLQDLYCVMIIGPKKTPYEDVPFFFDIQLPNEDPRMKS